jgi:hypothetical protein
MLLLRRLMARKVEAGLSDFTSHVDKIKKQQN